MLELGDRRVREQFEIVVRQAVGRWMTAVPFAWMPMPMPEPDRPAADRPRNEVSAVCRKRTIRAFCRPRSATPCHQLAQHARKRMPASVRNSFTPKAGLTPITTSLGIISDLGRTHIAVANAPRARARANSTSVRKHLASVEHVADGDRSPAAALADSR